MTTVSRSGRRASAQKPQRQFSRNPAPLFRNPLKERIGKHFETPELQSAALSVVLPELTTRGMLDQSRAGGCLNLECARLQSSFNVDVYALYTLLAGTSSRPEINTPAGEGVPLFPAGSVPLLHFHDPSCPYLVPTTSPTAPAAGNPRSWRYTASANPVEKIVPTVTTVLPLDMVPRSLPVAVGGEVYKLPSDFRTRPIARTRTADARVEYVWVDSCAATPTGFTVAVDVTLGCTTSLTTATVGVILKVILLGLDGAESSNVLPVVSGLLTLNGSSGKYEVSVAVSDLVSTSGWYRFAVDLTFPVVQAGAIYTAMTTYGRVQLDEFVKIGSGFFVDPTFTTMTALALRYWPSSSSSLISFRSPPLTAGGSIYGLNLRPWKDWQEPLSLGDGPARAQAPTSEMANGQQGYDIRNGMFTWEKQSVSPNALLDMSVDLPYVPSVNVQERPPLAYLIGASGGFDGGSVAYVDPSASQTGATVVLRIESTFLYCYQPRTKAITPSNFPLMLMPDQNNALQQALTLIPNFSENDWHEAFAKAAGVAFKVAKYIVHAAGAIAGNPLDAVQIFADVNKDWAAITGKDKPRFLQID